MRYPSPFAWPEGIQAAVSLTFDDGRESQLSFGLPVLDGCGVKATFYMTPGSADPRLADWQRVAEAGHEIGNHSVEHSCSGNFCWGMENALEDYTLEQMEVELLDAQAAMAERFGQAPRTFAYPCGQSFVGRGEDCRSYVPLVARHFLAGRRFRDETFNDPSFCDLARLAGTEGDRLNFEQLQTLLAQAGEQQAWVVLAMHDVGQQGPYQTVSADALRQLCEHCTDAANGIWIDTVEHIADYISRNRSEGPEVP